MGKKKTADLHRRPNLGAGTECWVLTQKENIAYYILYGKPEKNMQAWMFAIFQAQIKRIMVIL